MGKSVVILSFFMLIAGGCGQTTKKQAGVAINETVSGQVESDSTVQSEYDNHPVENEEKNFRQIGIDEKIGNRTLKDYLSDKKIPQIFKDVFQQKQSIFEDEEKTFPIIYTLSSTDKERHPFYFVLVTRTMWWADGMFAEGLGMEARKYVESNTRQFLDYFLTETVLTSYDFKQWAKFTLYEILIDSDENLEELENTRNKMKKNCKGCSSEKIKMIDKFIENMYAEYNEIQRRNMEWEKNNL